MVNEQVMIFLGGLYLVLWCAVYARKSKEDWHTKECKIDCDCKPPIPVATIHKEGADK